MHVLPLSVTVGATAAREQDDRVGAGLVLVGMAVAAVAIPKLVSVVNERWFSDIDAMDKDYPSDRTDPSWGSGGGHIGM